MGVLAAVRRCAGGAWMVSLLSLGLASAVFAQQRNLNIAPATPNEQRVALIIGNSNYADARLKNPANDATDIAAALKEIGFEVMLRNDATRAQMRAAIRDFQQALRRGGIGLFYFAGHGVQSGGRNYLIPVGADIKAEFDLEDESIDANYVLKGMEDAGNRVNIVILDACRNNPFGRSWRSAPSGGLGQMNAPSGSFVAFATAPGQVADDGSGKNGTFTKHLLANLRQGESDIDKVFTRVTSAVSTETGKRQVPWKSSSLTDTFRFRDDEPSTGSAGPELGERLAWDAIKHSTNPADFGSFLASYPKGYYADLARTTKANLERDLTLRQEELAKMEEQRRLQQARLEEERRLQAARLEEERQRAREQNDRMQAESRAREQQLARQRSDMELERKEMERKKKSTIFVPPNF